MPSVHRFTIFADYFQFIVQDEASEDDFASIWSPEALDLGTAIGTSAICSGTLRNVEVPIEIHILDAEPDVNLGSVDHAVEGSIALPSGTVMVMGCTGYFPDAPRFQVAPGTYRALSVMTGVSTIKNEWDTAEDRYLVYLWPGTPREPKLLKHWKGAA